jgi:UDP-glucose 4-epimerase
MRVLVTGGAGFIGSHLVDRLLADGHRVRVVDDCSTGREANLAPVAMSDRLEFRRGSVLDGWLMDRAMDGIQLVYHLAAAVGVHHVVQDPIRTVTTNIGGTEAVLERALRQGARVVFASSSEIYGTSKDLPFREDTPGLLGPTWVRRWSYATSKALDEHLCFGYADRGLAMSIVRYFNIYGPRLDPAGSGEPLTVHGDGGQSRCFTYASEAVDATVRAGTLPQALGQAFNVGNVVETTIEGLAGAVLRVTGTSVPIKYVPYEDAYGADFGDTRRRVPDVDKAHRLLGWRAAVTLDEGLALTVAAMRDAS